MGMMMRMMIGFVANIVYYRQLPLASIIMMQHQRKLAASLVGENLSLDRL